MSQKFRVPVFFMSVRISLISLFLFAAACGPRLDFSRTLAEDPAAVRSKQDPRYLTLNLGNYDQALIDKYAKQGIAEMGKTWPGHKEFRHLHLEVLERSKARSAEHNIVFGLATSSYHAGISDLGHSFDLIKYEVDFIILDAKGQPLGKNYWQVSYSLRGKDWYKTIQQKGSTADFYKALPSWAKTKLWHISGFLDGNSGVPPVPFHKTDGEIAYGVVGDIMGVIPGVLKSIPGSIAESYVREFGKQAIEKLLKSKELRFGFGHNIKNDQAEEHAAEYIATGEKLWAD